MTALPVNRLLSGVAVADMDRAVDWWTTFLGRGPDARPMPALADWYVPGGHTLQVVHDPGRAGGSLATLHVDDIDAARTGLAERGIDLVLDDTSSVRVRFGQVTDADGNLVSVIESKA